YYRKKLASSITRWMSWQYRQQRTFLSESLHLIFLPGEQSSLQLCFLPRNSQRKLFKNMHIAFTGCAGHPNLTSAVTTQVSISADSHNLFSLRLGGRCRQFWK